MIGLTTIARKYTVCALPLFPALFFVAACVPDSTPPEGARLTGPPASVAQAVSEGGPNPAPLQFTVDNSGQCPLAFSLTTTTANGGNWLTASPANGLVQPNGPGASVSVGIDVVTPVLLPGPYTGSIRVTGVCQTTGLAAAGSPKDVAVNLTVTPAGDAVLDLSSTLLGQDVVTLQHGWRNLTPEGGPDGRTGHTLSFTGRDLIVWGGDQPEWMFNNAVYNIRDDLWRLVGTTAPVADHTATWTGTRLLVWGGTQFFPDPFGNPELDYSEAVNEGIAYDPVGGTMTALSTPPASVAPRARHTAVWTGTSMLIYGGRSGAQMALATTARYTPSTNSWTLLQNAPGAGRWSHSAVWTGREMIVFGGTHHDVAALDDGARYDPVTNTWSTLNPVGTASARSDHTAIWTGSRMVVWGGRDLDGEPLGNGKRYNAATNAWTAMSNAGAPSPRYGHTAVWTGAQMIIWGGTGVDGTRLDDGAVWNAANDTWTPMSTTNTPNARAGHRAVWTGTGMLLWGGRANSGNPTALFQYR